MIYLDLKPFRKPIVRDEIGIYDFWIHKAIKEKKLIRQECRGKVYIIDPVRWMKTAKIEYHTYKRPDEPMRKYRNSLSRVALSAKEVDDLEVKLRFKKFGV